jgi:hypothetical protein
MRKFRPWALFIIAVLLAAILSRNTSTGSKIIGTGRNYLDLLHESNFMSAHLMLSDSLLNLLTPDYLQPLADEPPPGRIRAGREESRGFSLFVMNDQGGSRTLWLKRDSSGRWRINGDTSLDNILGNAPLICLDYARNTVIPGIARGDHADQYFCPVCGRLYSEQQGRLVCPAGHLGQGIDLGGAECQILRDSLLSVLEDYLSDGYPFPDSFSEMYSSSDGLYGKPGGYRCPDNGYSYYDITEQGIYCPFHDQLTRLPDSLAAPVESQLE